MQAEREKVKKLSFFSDEINPSKEQVCFYYTTNMSTFFVLRHPVAILVKDSTHPKNLTNDLLILIDHSATATGFYYLT